MTLRHYVNADSGTTITTPITNTATTFVVATGVGFPATPPFTAVLDYGLSTVEVVLVTAAAGANLTVTRGYDGTAAQSHGAGATIASCNSAIDFTEASTHTNASAGVHGVTGAVVGTTDTQTLTNKTLANPVISGADYQQPMTLYSPSFSSQAGGTPAVGNGVLVGAYRQTGKRVEFYISFNVGTGTNLGNGGFLFSLPVAARAIGVEWDFPCKVFTNNSSLLDFYGFAYTLNSTTVQPFGPASATSSAMGAIQNCDGTNAAGTGIPTIAGQYTFNPGANIQIQGWYDAA